ncbi:DUF1328 domain-containing protein [Brevundimonas naejangsanensis]
MYLNISHAGGFAKSGAQPSVRSIFRLFPPNGKGARNRQPRLSLRLGTKENDMIKWAIIFAIIAVVAGLLGFGGIAGAAASIAKFLAVLALIIFAIFLVLGFTVAKKVT